MLPSLTPETLALLALLGKATLLLLAAFAGATVLQRAPAGARHLLWLSTLGAILALPAIATWSPLRLAVIPGAWLAAPGEAAVRAPLIGAGTASPATDPLVDAAITRDSRSATDPAGSGGTTSAATTAGWHPSAWQLVFLVWGTVALAIGAWLAVGFMSVRRIIHRATPLAAREWSGALFDIADRLGVERTPRLVRSDDVKMPFAAGLLAPTVVLPAECDTWDEARRRAVLLHELAHLARNDLLGHTLARVACALYWFHPLVWSAARRLRLESERACDDLALSCGVRPSSYAEHLLDIVTSVRQPLTPAVAIPMADRKEFEGRMLAILDPDVRRQGSRRQSMTVVAALAALALLVGGTVPAAARAAATDPASTHPAGPAGAPSLGAVTPVAPPIPTASPAAAARPVPAPAPTTSRRAPLPESSLPSVALQLQQATGDDRAALLMQVLRTDTSATIRRTAAWGLERYAERAEVTTALAQALRGDANGGVREMAAWAIGGGDDLPAARAALVAALGSDKDVAVRETAAWALAQVTGHDRAEEVERALAAALRDDAAPVRATAMWALGSLGDGKAPPQVAEALGDREPRVRKMAAWVLHQREDPAAAPALEKALLKEEDAQVRVAMIRALGAFGDAASPTLARLLDSPDRDVRAAVVAALAGQHGGPWPMPMPRPRPYP